MPAIDPPFAYAEVGATAGELPTGYQHLTAKRIVGAGQPLFQQCAQTILRWGIQTGAGFHLANTDAVRVGGENRLGLHFGPFLTWAPCRVVYVVDEPNRKGFAYGTLAGHPECGEESFIASISPDGIVTFEIRAFSRPARWFARIGSPFVGMLQQHMTWKYLDVVTTSSVDRNPFSAATKRAYTSPDGSAFVMARSSRNVS